MHIGGISTELPLGRMREPEVKTVLNMFRTKIQNIFCDTYVSK
jgi:hypothetical protein